MSRDALDTLAQQLGPPKTRKPPSAASDNAVDNAAARPVLAAQVCSPLLTGC